MSNLNENNSLGAIAIIGMTGRFPGAKNIDELWNNLYKGVESVKFFSRDDLVTMGIDEHLLDNPKFVAADAILEDMDKFDANFFDYSAREAEIMDPQHRMFLESAYEVMESAGYNSELYDGRVAVYAGANLSGYMIRNLYSNPGLVESVGTFKIMLANGQDFLATRVSYKMNYLGPSVNVNTLCSSSAVAVHYACQNLLGYGCDIALAGGVSFQVSRNEAFFYQEGGIGAADGHCRAYDSKASGTVSGSGLAILVLKRLEDAIADGDHIHAVILGTGINNDGSAKNSFTAPNVDGQAECITEAIAMAGINPETITYIDGHGTGTNLGDPIEIAALTKAFRAYTKKKQYCAIGSVKTNIGHLVNAGGVASVIKTVLSMKHKMLPPSLNFEEPNPKIDFVNSPFYVNTSLADWKTEGYPLRAGVSSFGIGGTNMHIILEEAPAIEASEESKREYQLISLSAKTQTALEKMTSNLAEHIRNNADINLADAAFTLHVGRRNFNYRRIILCKDVQDLLDKLEMPLSEYVQTNFQKPKEQPIVFMFPGQGSERINGSLSIYKSEPVFSETIDHCAAILEPMLGKDIRNILYPESAKFEEAYKYSDDEIIKNSVLFVVEYALAKLWMEWDIIPEKMIGEGIGEYVAACLSNVISLEDALKLVSVQTDSLYDQLSKITFKKPEIPFISSITGTWITDKEAESQEYWLHRYRTTGYHKGFKEFAEDIDQILIEMIPGNNLFISVGQFWLKGGRVNWNKFYASEKRHRIPLPTYPFEKKSYWIEPGKRAAEIQTPDAVLNEIADITEDISNSVFQEGTITVSINLENKEKSKKQLEEILSLKKRIEELCEEFESISANTSITPVGLRVHRRSETNQTEVSRKLVKMERPEMSSQYTAPRNEVERIIANKWEDVLGYDRIGINDDFFELGGHSLIAAAIASELGKVFNVNIPMSKLFEASTISQVAELIDEYSYRFGYEQTAASNEEDMEFGEI